MDRLMGVLFLSNAERCLQVSRWRIDPFPVPRLELNTEQGTQHHRSTEQGHNIIDQQNQGTEYQRSTEQAKQRLDL
jgi:hypothetical protein